MAPRLLLNRVPQTSFSPAVMAVEKRPFHSPSGKTGEAKFASLPPTSFDGCRLTAAGQRVRLSSTPGVRFDVQEGLEGAVSSRKPSAGSVLMRSKSENVSNLAF